MENGISVGGTLYLLTDKLVFQTNAINYIKRHEYSIGVNHIKEVNFGTKMNALEITTTYRVEEFIVNNRQIWKDNF